MRAQVLAIAAVLACSSAGVAVATTSTFTGSAGGRAASVIFDNSTAGKLIVTLTNTATADVDEPDQILTTVFFSLNSTITLNPFTAKVPTGSTIDGSTSNLDVGSDWGYLTGLSASVREGATSVIASSGLVDGLGHSNFLVNGVNVDNQLNGVGYGITSAGDNLATRNGGLNGRPLIQNSVVFTFNVSDAISDGVLTGITNVVFQYGTDLSEPHFTGTYVPPPNPPVGPGGGAPEPETLALLALGLLAGHFLRHRKAT